MHNSGRNLPLLDMLENGCLLWVGKLSTERLLHELCYFHQLPPLTPTQIFTQCVQEIRQFIRKTLYLKPGHQHSFLLSFHHAIRSGSQPETLVNMHACIYFKSLRVVEPDHDTTWHHRHPLQKAGAELLLLKRGLWTVVTKMYRSLTKELQFNLSFILFSYLAALVLNCSSYWELRVAKNYAPIY